MRVRGCVLSRPTRFGLTALVEQAKHADPRTAARFEGMVIVALETAGRQRDGVPMTDELMHSIWDDTQAANRKTRWEWIRHAQRALSETAPVGQDEGREAPRRKAG